MKLLRKSDAVLLLETSQVSMSVRQLVGLVVGLYNVSLLSFEDRDRKCVTIISVNSYRAGKMKHSRPRKEVDLAIMRQRQGGKN